MKKKNIRSNVNRLVTLGLAILVSIIVCGVFLWLMLGVILSGHDSRDRAEPYEYNNWTFYVYHDDIPLRIEDLVKTNYNGYSYEMITDSASPLLRYQEVRQRPRYDALAEPELEYRIAEVQVPWIYDYVQEQMLADFSHNYGYPEDDPNWEEHRSIDPTPWNAASAYQLVLSGEPMQRYLLCYEGSILEIDLDWIPTEAQMEIIYETLLP